MFNTDIANHFWTWFRENNKRYLNIFTVDKEKCRYLIDELQLHVEDICTQLVCEVSVNKENSRGCLVISADRDYRYFETAKQLTALAPLLPGWDFFALRPPRQLDLMFEEEHGHTGIDPCKLRFSPFFENDIAPTLDGIYMYVPGYESKDNYRYLMAVYHVLENLMGEEALTTVLGSVTLLPLTESDLQCPCVYPIQELPAFLDSLPSVYKVNKEGEIYVDEV